MSQSPLPKSFNARSFAIGLISLALLAAWSHWHCVLVVNRTSLNDNSPPVGAVGVFLGVLLIVCLYEMLNRKLRLPRGELIVIYAMLAVPFKSYTQPLIIMITVPFGIVGAVIGHIIMGYDLSILSMFGVVALAGVVVNDSLVMIDFANRVRQTGLGAFAAITQAGVQRFRPIMLTTLTTFGGLAPMIFETSRQARFLIPMAISLGYGILFATLITLVLVPALYVIVDDLARLKTRLYPRTP